MPRPLEGRTVALAESRQLAELAQLLEAEGAVPLRCPMVGIHDAPDPGPVLDWIAELVAGRLGLVVLMTGEAVRRLLGLADRAGLRESFVESLGRTRTIVRGPKPILALKELGLSPSVVAQPPTTEGVIAALRAEPLAGQTVGLTLYGEPNRPLEEFLTAAGATVRAVLPYVYAPAAETARVADLIQRLAKGEVDCIIFTSSPQVDRLHQVAVECALEEELRQGLQRTQVAAVGPVVAATLRQRGVRVDVCPERGFVMKNLVRLLARQEKDEDP